MGSPHTVVRPTLPWHLRPAPENKEPGEPGPRPMASVTRDLVAPAITTSYTLSRAGHLGRSRAERACQQRRGRWGRGGEGSGWHSAENMWLILHLWSLPPAPSLAFLHFRALELLTCLHSTKFPFYTQHISHCIKCKRRGIYHEKTEETHLFIINHSQVLYITKLLKIILK